MSGNFQDIDGIIKGIQERNIRLLCMRHFQRFAGAIGMPCHFAPHHVLQYVDDSLAKNGLLHDDHHTEGLFHHALFAGDRCQYASTTASPSWLVLPGTGQRRLRPCSVPGITVFQAAPPGFTHKDRRRVVFFAGVISTTQ